ncbi:AMP-binding protein (plasmid) [Glutamicibacter sp. FR1]|uniref:AMP-binding protein n=1 Tax=Glutamicibacter sp. FR1 TaxID=3393744 RepID=UPI0039AF74A4
MSQSPTISSDGWQLPTVIDGTLARHSSQSLAGGIERYVQILSQQDCSPSTLIVPDFPRGVELVALLVAGLRLGLPVLPVDFLWGEAKRQSLRALPEQLLICTLGGSASLGLEADVVLPPLGCTQEVPGWSSLAVPPESGTAIVLPTSGSTGEPKFVMIPKGALLKHVDWIKNQFSVTNEDCILAEASPAFDAGIWEILLACRSGATLCVPDEYTVKDGIELLEYAKQTRVSIVHFTPTMLDHCASLSAQAILTVRLVVLGGERLNVRTVVRARALFPNAKVVNVYGPSETIIHATSFDATLWMDSFSGDEVPNDGVPIGEVIVGREVRLAPHTAIPGCVPASTGNQGRAIIGGVDGIATGYLGMPGLTARAFRPVASGRREFYTQDLLVSDGSVLKFVSRLDDARKVLGHLVSPSAIARALESAVGVRAAVVAFVSSDEHTLVSEVQLEPESLQTAEGLRSYLLMSFPAVAVPQQIRITETFAMSDNGKSYPKHL